MNGKENSNLKTRYGITVEQRNKMFLEQDGLCAICSTELSVKIRASNKACVDHCHESGIIRGLLCLKCNSALGKFNDSLELVKSAVKYLEGKGVDYEETCS